MYKAFYGFNKTPFAKNIDTPNLFMHENLRELESRLEYMKKAKGLMLVSGPSGSGKTSGVRRFVNCLPVNSFVPIYIPLATVSVKDFYDQLNTKLGGAKYYAKSQVFKSIQERIMNYTVNMNKIPVIVIDEAHLLKNDNFFELQIILNFEMDSLDPALFILVAQDHLNERLKRKFLDSFNQRINMKFYFQALSKAETEEFIVHNIKLVGGSPDIFPKNACKAIYTITGGIIRKVGKLVVKSLTYGATLKKQIMTEDDILAVSNEL